MELGNSKKSLYVVILTSAAFLLLLGTWWLYLVFKLSSKLEELNHPQVQGDLLSMIKWEGASFIVLLFTLTIALIYIYLQDFKKNKAIQSFFASLTHELKSPLASMKLQAQVVQEQIEKLDISEDKKTKLSKYSDRLFQDSTRLEDKLDNSLQLSRVERGASLNLRNINLHSFLQSEAKRFCAISDLTINIKDIPEDLHVLADDFALQTIMRNFIENTLRHNKSSSKILDIQLEKAANDQISLSISDNGDSFKGNPKMLKTLFYKFDSPGGSGVGLYLIDKLMHSMHGDFQIESTPKLIFKLQFKRVS